MQYASNNKKGGDGDDAWGWLRDSWGEWIIFYWLTKTFPSLACRYEEIVWKFWRIRFGIIDVLVGSANVHQCAYGNALDNKDSKESWRWQMFKTSQMIVQFVEDFGSKQDWWKKCWLMDMIPRTHFWCSKQATQLQLQNLVTNKPCILYRAVTLCIEFKVRFDRESFVIWWRKNYLPPIGCFW